MLGHSVEEPDRRLERESGRAYWRDDHLASVILERQLTLFKCSFQRLKIVMEQLIELGRFSDRRSLLEDAGVVCHWVDEKLEELAQEGTCC